MNGLLLLALDWLLLWSGLLLLLLDWLWGTCRAAVSFHGVAVNLDLKLAVKNELSENFTREGDRDLIALGQFARGDQLRLRDVLLDFLSDFSEENCRPVALLFVGGLGPLLLDAGHSKGRPNR